MIERLSYRTAEAQAALGIRRTAFWKLVKAGKIETRHVGGVTVVPAASLQKLLQAAPPKKLAA